MGIGFRSGAAAFAASEAEIDDYLAREGGRLSAAARGELGDPDRLGWFHVDRSAPASLIGELEREAERLRGLAEVLIVVGVGGSNRAAVAAVEALRGRQRPAPPVATLPAATPGASLAPPPMPAQPLEIHWAGDSLSAARLSEARRLVEERSAALLVIAKDFNTVEPGIAFRVLRTALERRYGKAHAERIVVVGSRGPGQLEPLAARAGCRFFDFPEDIGGRYSALSAVGLLPMAAAGLDIASLADGARAMERSLSALPVRDNPAFRYAAARRILLSKGFGVESLVVLEPSLQHLSRWWIQLFAESEGKGPEALFPVSFSYSEDLHAMGQYVQEGRRFIAETYLLAFRESEDFRIEPSSGLDDGFAYLDGRPFSALNRAVLRAALDAHSEAGVPCLELEAGELSEASLGALFYFFLYACYASSLLGGVNPFDQNGVEGYKRRLYAILGKRA